MLNPTRLGLAGGILWAVSLFICTIVSFYTGYATEFLTILASVYPGYSISWLGATFGILYGFLDAFIGLFILAWIYNKLGGGQSN